MITCGLGSTQLSSISLLISSTSSIKERITSLVQTANILYCTVSCTNSTQSAKKSYKKVSYILWFLLDLSLEKIIYNNPISHQ